MKHFLQLRDEYLDKHGHLVYTAIKLKASARETEAEARTHTVLPSH